MTDHVVTQFHEHHAEIILNRLDKRNAINWAMMDAISAALDEIEAMGGFRAIILRGEGAHFSAGIDLLGFQNTSERFGEGWRENLFPLTAAYQAVTNKLESCTIPTICLMHGISYGLALELALACDFRIAAEDTRMGLIETRVGLIPDVGGTARLTRLIGIARAKEYIMTGKEFKLDDAERWGVVNYVVAQDQVLAKAHELIAELAAAAPLAVRFAKLAINDMLDISSALKFEAWAQAQLIMSEDFAVGVQAMLTKQPAAWKAK